METGVTNVLTQPREEENKGEDERRGWNRTAKECGTACFDESGENKVPCRSTPSEVVIVTSEAVHFCFYTYDNFVLLVPRKNVKILFL